MQAQRWDRVKHVFQEALDRAPHERTAYVRERCAGDSAVRAEVESLLATHDRVGSFAEQPAVELLGALPNAPDVPTSGWNAYALTVGDRLGVYEIQSLIGAGGMGEVYQARDTRLDRTVAIKVLRAHVSANPRSRDRFEREARAVAALNHPHICTLHDIGHHEGIDFLVLEYLAGETLATRLAKGPLTLDHALGLAVQIASALDAAHTAGIVHRDLKPGNVFLVRSGGSGSVSTAKLLDFGLAKAHEPVSRSGSSPRLSPPETTVPGAIIGTVQYMAPEQLERRAADARSDIFAFGAVLYEMVAGRRAFEGNSDAGLIAAILEHDPPALASLQPLAPPFLDRIVRTCLAKDPGDRWQSARDLRLALHWLCDGEMPSQAAIAPPRKARIALIWTATIALAALAGLSAAWFLRPPPAASPTVSFSIHPPAGTKFTRGTAEMALAPDGRRLAFVALSADGIRRLWVQPFDVAAARALEGTEGAWHPFWSPDGRSVGFFANGKLKTISESGGVPRVLCEVPLTGRGGTWNRDGVILFADALGPIRRVAETGGTARPITTLDASRGERGHLFPVFLPDGRRFLYSVRVGERDQLGIYQASLDSTQASRVLSTDSNAALAGRQLLSLRNGSLIASSYDPDRAQVVDTPVPIAESIAHDSLQRSVGAFSVANSVVAYRSASPDSHLVWFDRGGKEVGAFRAPGDYHHPWLGQDENQVAIERTDQATGRHTIWMLDIERGTTSRLVTDPTGAHQPVLSPDGRWLVFSSNRLGGVDLYRIRTDGVEGDELLLNSPELIGLAATDWSRDGRLVLYEARPHEKGDLWILPASPGEKPQAFLVTAASSERHGQFSPDMGWIAYTSDESGAPEVYVRRFPGATGKWQVSTQGGAQPRWRGDGKELFFLAPDGKLMAAAVTADQSRFETGTPQSLFNTGITTSFMDRRNQYVVTQDGQRFLVNISAEDESPAPITVVMNWEATTNQK